MSNTKIYAPLYFKSFKCTADACRHSCCIDWEICIDDEALDKYKKHADIMAAIRQTEDGPCFALTADGRCPHLNSRGLCDIIIAHGEEYLCEICSNHPRFYNHVYGGRIEAGLGIVCEEACRLVLENEGEFFLSVAESVDCDVSVEFDTGFNPLPIRDDIILQIQSQGRFDDKVTALQEQFGIGDLRDACEWIDVYLRLEILDEEWAKTLRNSKGKEPCPERSFDKYYERLLVYFVYRHVSIADSQYDLASRLGFAVLSVKMIMFLFETGMDLSLDGLKDIARRYSAEIEYCEDNTYELIFELGAGVP